MVHLFALGFIKTSGNTYYVLKKIIQVLFYERICNFFHLYNIWHNNELYIKGGIVHFAIHIVNYVKYS